MDKQLKFEIIIEGQKYGVTATCKKHNISRTLYYRWLKRYKTHGIEGLGKIEKSFTPVNKTKPEIVSTILNLIKKHPKFGPREIKYLLEEIGYDISESAVYNVMNRNNLTKRAKRLKFANKSEKKANRNYPDFGRIKSGECWLCWTTFCGEFEALGSIYAYTIFDYKSKIACTRLYNQLSMKNFEDILTGLAIPVAQSLSAEGKHLCFFDNDITVKQKGSLLSYTTVQHFGYDINVHMLKESDDLTEANELRKEYTHRCLSFLMPLIYKGVSFNKLKIDLQSYIRDYNIKNKLSYNGELYSPVEYHAKSTNAEVILPLWAYIERQY
ncbi:helix-turn-helix domain-containing protein [Proteinivorax hydrogeniformans]|uniref:Helix-turn-helix domain-containing protein n=1 Tax=Proteinivorax hydrogeniformans TaxID=1826727 RepID=A0AAU8HT05_9FIRM